MNTQQVAIGAVVRSSDGESLGRVEHLIVDAKTKELSGFVADRGIFDSGRVVDLEYVHMISEEEVTLTLTSNQARELPGFVEHEFMRFGEATELSAGAAGGLVNIGSSGGVWMHYGPGGGSLPSTGSESYFPQGIVGNVAAQIMSPLTDSELILNNGTDVVDNHGEKLGVVDDIIIGDEGDIQGFIVQQGFLFHHDIYVPIEWVTTMTREHVRLSVDRSEAERSKR